MTSTQELIPTVLDNLATARFYGAKSEEITGADIVREQKVDDFLWLILDVKRDSGSDFYQLFVDSAGKDALVTAEGAAAFISAVSSLGETKGGGIVVDVEPRPIGGEQSNTSLIVGDRVFKVFRKLEPGLNPDVELLSGIADCSAVAGVHGYSTVEIDGAPYTLTMTQDLVPQAKDGWEFALTLTDKVESFAMEADLLGTATKTVHDALKAKFPTEQTTGEQLAQRLNTHFDELVVKAPVLKEFEDEVRAIYGRLADYEEPIELQRIHGDLHLGQVLRSDGSYTLIDFEGEPARSLEDRRKPDVALRDVAGLVRSIDYAAHFHNGGKPTEESIAWASAATTSLLRGYRYDFDADIQQILLDAYILDKACYEVVYETNNRPDWVEIPLTAIKQLVAKN